MTYLVAKTLLTGNSQLLYTTFIMSTCVIIALLAVIGLNQKTYLNVVGWININCM